METKDVAYRSTNGQWGTCIGEWLLTSGQVCVRCLGIFCCCLFSLVVFVWLVLFLFVGLKKAEPELDKTVLRE